jgi:hypothetical protein
MSLNYDFDIHSIIPETVTADPKIAKMMGDVGFDFGGAGNKMALFRDPATVQALRGADPEVRAYFEASGFGFTVFDSGAGPGRFPAKFEADINNTIQRLSDNVEKFELGGKDWNGFEMGTFLEHVVAMKPVEMAPPVDPFSAPPHQGAPADPFSGPPDQGAALDADASLSPLDRVRARHAAPSAHETPQDFMAESALPNPEVDVNPEMSRQRAASDRAYRLKKGLPLVGLGLLLFVVAIAQGRNLSNAPEVSTAEAEPAVTAPADTAIQTIVPTTETQN